MFTPNDILIEAFSRLPEGVHDAVSGLSRDQLRERPGGVGNPIGWLAWHLARVEDAQVADVGKRTQVWDEGWRERFDLPYAADATGYGMSSDDVSAFDVADPQLLIDYYDKVHARTLVIVGGLSQHDLARIVDRRWDPPVTAMVRLVSVINDATQHVGQAAYVRGLLGHDVARASDTQNGADA